MSAQTFWDDRYKGSDYVYGTEPNDFLREKCTCIPTKAKILCLAEGEGRNAVYLASLGFDVTAVDISPISLQKGQALARKMGVSVDWICADLSNFDMENAKWDAVVAIFMHLPSHVRQKVLAQITFALRVGGCFIGEFYRKEQLTMRTGGPTDAEMLYCPTILKQELNPLFCEYHAILNREVFEGIGHHGMAAVVQIVARRL